jgi:hypothetical protein
MQQPLHSIEGHAYQQRVAQEQQKRAAHSAAEQQQQQQQQAAQYQEQYQAMVRRPPLRADCPLFASTLPLQAMAQSGFPYQQNCMTMMHPYRAGEILICRVSIRLLKVIGIIICTNRDHPGIGCFVRSS